MSKLISFALLAGTLGACTLSSMPPPPGESGIASFCRSEGHQMGTDAYAACLSNLEGFVLVQDLAQRNGGITPFR